MDRLRRRRTLRRTLRVLADVVPDPAEVEAATRDVDDDDLFVLAREHEADYVVTGDNDLHEWPEQRSPVLTPATFGEPVGSKRMTESSLSESAPLTPGIMRRSGSAIERRICAIDAEHPLPPSRRPDATRR